MIGLRVSHVRGTLQESKQLWGDLSQSSQRRLISVSTDSVTFRRFLRDGSIPLFWLVDHLEATCARSIVGSTRMARTRELLARGKRRSLVFFLSSAILRRFLGLTSGSRDHNDATIITPCNFTTRRWRSSNSKFNLLQGRTCLNVI